MPCSRGADIEHRDKKGFTPLILAATAGHDKVEITVTVTVTVTDTITTTTTTTMTPPSPRLLRFC